MAEKNELSEAQRRVLSNLGHDQRMNLGAPRTTRLGTPYGRPPVSAMEGDVRVHGRTPTPSSSDDEIQFSDTRRTREMDEALASQNRIERQKEEILSLKEDAKKTANESQHQVLMYAKLLEDMRGEMNEMKGLMKKGKGPDENQETFPKGFQPISGVARQFDLQDLGAAIQQSMGDEHTDRGPTRTESAPCGQIRSQEQPNGTERPNMAPLSHTGSDQRRPGETQGRMRGSISSNLGVMNNIDAIMQMDGQMPADNWTVPVSEGERIEMEMNNQYKRPDIQTEMMDVGALPAAIVDFVSTAKDRKPELTGGFVLPEELPSGTTSKVGSYMVAHENNVAKGRSLALQFMRNAIKYLYPDWKVRGSISTLAVRAATENTWQGREQVNREKGFMPAEITFDGTGDIEDFFEVASIHLQGLSSRPRAALLRKCLRGEAILALRDAPPETFSSDETIMGWLRRSYAVSTTPRYVQAYMDFKLKPGIKMMWFAVNLRQAYVNANPTATNYAADRLVRRDFLMRIPSAKARSIPSLSKLTLLEIAQYIDIEENEHRTIGITGIMDRGSVFSTEMTPPGRQESKVEKEIVRKPTDRVVPKDSEPRGYRGSTRESKPRRESYDNRQRYPPKSSTNAQRGRDRSRDRSYGRRNSRGRDDSRGSGYSTGGESRGSSTSSTRSANDWSVCYRCKATGHYARDCPIPEVCFNCGKEGHRSPSCPNASGQDRYSRYRDVECYGCGKKGHLKRHCNAEETRESNYGRRDRSTDSKSKGTEKGLAALNTVLEGLAALKTDRDKKRKERPRKPKGTEVRVSETDLNESGNPR
jgi:uncharacterized membrane protein YgcG